MAELVRPSAAYRHSFLEAERELAGERRTHDAARFDGMLAMLDELRCGRVADHVAQTTLWLVEDDEYVGKVDLRHELDDFFATHGGHVGYEVRPSYRRRGLGARALALALPQLAALGIDPALATCDASNIASRKIIERCGGVFESERPPMLRFWIATSVRRVV